MNIVLNHFFVEISSFFLELFWTFQMPGILFVEDLNDVNDVSQNVLVVVEPTCEFETFFEN